MADSMEAIAPAKGVVGKSMLKKLSIQEIVKLYTVDHLTMEQIGEICGVTRQAIWRRLKKAGIKAEDGEWLEFKCEVCKKTVKIRRCENRMRKGARFCSKECYFQSIKNPGYKEWRQGQRIARYIVSKYFNLSNYRKAVIHHKDGGCRNNALSNLVVFASQSEHMAHHRGKTVKPIFDGCKVVGKRAYYESLGGIAENRN